MRSQEAVPFPLLSVWLVTTNLDYDDWYAFLGQTQMVSALLDRLRHRCSTITIDGPSLRRPAA